MLNKSAAYIVMALLLVATMGMLPGFVNYSLYAEALILAFMAMMVTLKFVASGAHLNSYLINGVSDVYIIVFFVIWLVVSFLNQSFGVPNLLALIRYIVVAYFVGVYVSFDRLRNISFLVFLLGASQIIVGSLQMLNIIPLVLVDVEIEKDGMYGVFDNNVSFAALLLVSLIVYGEILSKNRSLITHMIAIIFLCFIFLSGSRAYFLIATSYYIIGILRLPMWHAIVTGVAVFAVTTVFGVDLGKDNRDFLYFLSSSYIDMAMQQRLGLVFELFPQYVFSIDYLLGFGSDKEYAVKTIIEKYNFFYLSPVNLQYIIEDVYWLAMAFYYGLLGSLAFVFYYFGAYRLFSRLQKQEVDKSGYTSLFIWIFTSSLLLGFVGQALEVKIFSMLFWLYVGALIVLRKSRFKLHRNNALKMFRSDLCLAESSSVQKGYAS